MNVKNRKFYFELGAVLLAALASASLMTSQINYRGLLAGITAISALGLMKAAESSSLATGRTDRMKAALVGSTTLYEFVLLLGASSPNVIPKALAAVTVASVGFVELLHLESEQRLKTSFTKDVGRTGRIVVLGLSLMAFSFNTYYLFYGLAFVALLAVYDSARLIHHIRKEI